MNAFRRPSPIELPNLSSDYVKTLFKKTHDLVILLDDKEHVVGSLQDDLFDELDQYNWIGQNFSDLLCIDSIGKLKALLENDAAKESNDARWRHINLRGLDSRVFPVLAKAMSIPGDSFSKIVFCRDLRPMELANKNFLQLQQQLELTNQTLRNKLTEKDNCLINQGLFNVKELVSSIKQSTYSQVIKDTVLNLERQCLQALLKDADGNQALAAKMAGLHVDELIGKLNYFKNH